MTHKETAQKLGVHYLFGRWGINFLPKDPTGKIYRLFSLIPLDNWQFKESEILQAMFDDPAWEVRNGDIK